MLAEIRVRDIVQGVGFRPFIYRIPVKNELVGYVRNRGDAFVEIVVEGKKGSVDQFLLDLLWSSGCSRVPTWLTRTDLCYATVV